MLAAHLSVSPLHVYRLEQLTPTDTQEAKHMIIYLAAPHYRSIFLVIISSNVK